MNQDWEPEDSDILSVPVVEEVSLNDELLETSEHEMEVNVLVRGRSGVRDKTLFWSQSSQIYTLS